MQVSNFRSVGQSPANPIHSKHAHGTQSTKSYVRNLWEHDQKETEHNFPKEHLPVVKVLIRSRHAKVEHEDFKSDLLRADSSLKLAVVEDGVAGFINRIKKHEEKTES